MNQTGIYRKAIQRAFAELYSVSAESVEVVWDPEGITVQCAGKTFTNQTGSEKNTFVSEDEDPVTVILTDDERYHLTHRVWAPTSAPQANLPFQA